VDIRDTWLRRELARALQSRSGIGKYTDFASFLVQRYHGSCQPLYSVSGPQRKWDVERWTISESSRGESEIGTVLTGTTWVKKPQTIALSIRKHQVLWQNSRRCCGRT